MAKFVHYQCPDCRGTFKHLHHPSDAPPPDRCPLCGSWVSDAEPPQEVFVPQAPAVHGASAKAKAVDDVYYGMEDASVARTHMMAEAAGGSASDYDHTKITNLRNTKEGEIAAVPAAPNPVSTLMQQTPQTTGHQHNITAQGYAAATTSGIGAYAGERTRQQLTKQHHDNVRQLVGGATMGVHR
jgi:hypothetical protein